MTALKASDVERFLRRPDLDEGAILAYGPDAGLVREAGHRLARHYSGADPSAMNLVTLDGTELDADPGRLLVEARTASLFGDRRVIRVRGASKSVATTLSALLDDPAGAVVVLEAGNLVPRDPLRALVEASRMGRTLPCYPDSDAQIERLVADWLTEAGIRADAGAVATLRDSLGNDREVTRRELEKLALYAGPGGTITSGDVLTLCADNAALAIDDVLDSVGTGHAERLEAALARALSAAVNPQQILTMALGHFTQLRRWRAEVDAGRSLRDVLEAARPRPHFSRRALIEQQVRLWSDAALAAALQRLQLAVADARKRYGLAETVSTRALLAVATMAAQA